MIEKLKNTSIDANGIGYDIQLEDVIAKVNEIIDYLNGIRFLRKPNAIACIIDDKLIEG